MKKVSYLILFVLFCTSFLIFNLIFSYTLNYLFLSLLKLNKYNFIPFIIKASAALTAMNMSIKLIFKFFYVERSSVKKLVEFMKLFIVIFSLLMVLVYGFNDITSIYNMITYLVFALISMSFVNDFVKGYAGKIV